MAKKLPEPEGACGVWTGRAGTAGDGRVSMGWRQWRRRPSEQGSREDGTRLRRGGVVGQPPVCVRHRSGPDKGWMSRRETHAEQPDTG